MATMMKTLSLEDEKVNLRNYPSFEEAFAGSDHPLQKNLDISIQRSILEKIIYNITEEDRFEIKVNNQQFRPELLVRVRRHIIDGRDILEISFFSLFSHAHEEKFTEVAWVQKLQNHFWVKTSDIISSLK